MNKKLYIYIGITCFILLVGCKSTKEIKSSATSGEIRDKKAWITQVEEQAFQFTTLTARLNADLKLPGNSVSSRVDLKMVRDSAFQLSIQPFLGIEVFRIEVSRDSVKVIDRMNKRYVAENYAKLKGETPVAFNFYNLQALFTNHLFLPGSKQLTAKDYNHFQITKEGDESLLTVQDAMDLSYAFSTDREAKLQKTRVTDGSGQYQIEWKYGDFRSTEKQIFPMLMAVDVQKNQVSQGGISLRFSKVQVDEPLKLECAIPAKYQRITFAQILKSLSNLQGGM